MDEILEGYRTFTALAAEVSTPGGSGIMSRYGTEPTTRSSSSSSSTSRRIGTTAMPTSSSSSGTLDDYAPNQQQERGGGSQHLARRGGGEPVEGGALARQEGGRRGQGVPYVDPASDPVMMDALRLLFAKEGNYVQDLVRFACRVDYPYMRAINPCGVGCLAVRAGWLPGPSSYRFDFPSIAPRHEANLVALDRVFSRSFL